MRRLLIVLLFACPILAHQADARHRPISTYSIVARDPHTGQLGVAVQSHWFCVGCVVSWARAGVGAVATQSFIDPSYGSLGLEMMRLGHDAPQVLKGLLMADANRAIRQVAMVDAQGRVAVWTGADNIQAAGHFAGSVDSSSSYESLDGGTYTTGKNYSVQANLMADARVWPAMARAFETANGDLAARMLASLEAAQSVGGDARGRQSAALIVVRGRRSGVPWTDRLFDLRVDDHPTPLKELRRLITIARAYNHMEAGDLAMEHGEYQAALRQYRKAERLTVKQPVFGATRRAEMFYWHAVALVNMGRVKKSLPLFERVFALREAWRAITARLPEAGLLPDIPKIIRRVEAVGKGDKTRSAR
jgi:uncharacterized Ntn-hydrolase superfamily protein